MTDSQNILAHIGKTNLVDGKDLYLNHLRKAIQYYKLIEIELKFQEPIKRQLKKFPCSQKYFVAMQESYLILEKNCVFETD